MPKPGKGHYLVDDELDAWEYADEYVETENWKEKKRVAKEKGEDVEDEKPAATVPKPKPAPKPKPVAKPAPAAPPPPPPEELPEFLEPKLETFDDWEAAMDALDNHISAQEEKKVAAAQKAKGGR